MKKTISFCDFQDSFTNCGRGDSFTYDWLKALYEYLTQLEDDCGIEIELDAIALDCDYTEYDSVKEAYEAYQDDYDELCEDEEERDERANEYLNDNTQVIHMDNGGVIIANF